MLFLYYSTYFLSVHSVKMIMMRNEEVMSDAAYDDNASSLRCMPGTLPAVAACLTLPGDSYVLAVPLNGQTGGAGGVPCRCPSDLRTPVACFVVTCCTRYRVLRTTASFTCVVLCGSYYTLDGRDAAGLDDAPGGLPSPGSFCLWHLFLRVGASTARLFPVLPYAWVSHCGLVWFYICCRLLTCIARYRTLCLRGYCTGGTVRNGLYCCHAFAYAATARLRAALLPQAALACQGGTCGFFCLFSFPGSGVF